MNDDFVFPPTLPIPTCWSPEQALSMADFLGDIIAAIWRVYGSDITRYLEQHGPARPPGSTAVNCHEGDIPF